MFRNAEIRKHLRQNSVGEKGEGTKEGENERIEERGDWERWSKRGEVGAFRRYARLPTPSPRTGLRSRIMNVNDSTDKSDKCHNKRRS